MAQFDFGNLESPLSGTVFINGNLEPWRDALHSSHKGGTRPSYAVEGMLWVNDTTNPWVLNMFDGANDIALGSFDTTTNTFTPSGVSQAAEDISFDNTDSGLTATNVQDAIDEAVSDFSDFEGRAAGFATAAQGVKADNAAPTATTFSGTYTPTLFNVQNVGASQAYECTYMRVGNMATVSGKVDVDPITTTDTELGISLPIASDFALPEQCGGAGGPLNYNQAAGISADAANNRAKMQFVAVTGNLMAIYFNFSYRIL